MSDLLNELIDDNGKSDDAASDEILTWLQGLETNSHGEPKVPGLRVNFLGELICDAGHVFSKAHWPLLFKAQISVKSDSKSGRDASNLYQVYYPLNTARLSKPDGSLKVAHDLVAALAILAQSEKCVISYQAVKPDGGNETRKIDGSKFARTALGNLTKFLPPIGGQESDIGKQLMAHSQTLAGIKPTATDKTSSLLDLFS